MIVLENFLDPYDLFELMRTNYSCKAEVSHCFGLGMHLVCDFRFFDNSNCSYSLLFEKSRYADSFFRTVIRLQIPHCDMYV